MVRKKRRTTGIHREKGERTKEEENIGGIFIVFPTGATSPRTTRLAIPARNTTQGPLNAIARPGRNKGSRRHLSSGPFPAKTIARLPPVPQRRIEQILRDRRHRATKDKKKRHDRIRIDLFYVSLWCAKKGGHRESTEKKERERKKKKI